MRKICLDNKNTEKYLEIFSFSNLFHWLDIITHREKLCSTFYELILRDLLIKMLKNISTIQELLFYKKCKTKIIT